MAVEIVMPKQGNSVESCLILNWKVKVGDQVSVGDIVCEAETDKSTIDVESTSGGTVLALLYNEEDEVPVMAPIMVVGEKGEKVDVSSSAEPQKTEEVKVEAKAQVVAPESPQQVVQETREGAFASPRAKHTARDVGVFLDEVSPTGPKGRIIERDVLRVASSRPSLSPLAKEAALQGKEVPERGSGIGGRVLRKDLINKTETTPSIENEFVVKPVKGIRKVVAHRMAESVHTTAQFTMSSFANATTLQAMRKRLKNSDPSMGLTNITINDLVMFAVTKTLHSFPYMNAHFLGDSIKEFHHVQLGCAVDTPRGLLVPVIKYANLCSLKELSDEAKRVAYAAIDGASLPDELTGSTFTVTNLGNVGVETFTPIINIPEVAILGVGGINVRPVGKGGDDVSFVPHIAFSLTINHMAVDGAPGAAFLAALVKNIESLDLLLAL